MSWTNSESGARNFFWVSHVHVGHPLLISQSIVRELGCNWRVQDCIWFPIRCLHRKRWSYLWSYSASPKRKRFKKKFIWNEERECTGLLCKSLQTPESGPGCSQGTGLPPRSLTRMERAQCSSGYISRENWIESGTMGTWTNIRVGFWYCWRWYHPLCHNTGPKLKGFERLNWVSLSLQKTVYKRQLQILQHCVCFIFLLDVYRISKWPNKCMSEWL